MGLRARSEVPVFGIIRSHNDLAFGHSSRNACCLKVGASKLSWCSLDASLLGPMIEQGKPLSPVFAVVSAASPAEGRWGISHLG